MPELRGDLDVWGFGLKDYQLSLLLQVQSCRRLVYEILPPDVWKMREQGVPIDTVGAMIVVDFYGIEQPARVLEPAVELSDCAVVELFRNQQN